MIFRFTFARATRSFFTARLAGLLLWALAATMAGAADSELSEPEERTAPDWYRRLIALRLGNAARAISDSEERLAAVRATGDTVGEAYALLALGAAQGRLSQYPAAPQNTAKGLELAMRQGVPVLLREARYRHASSLVGVSDFTGALELYLLLLRQLEPGESSGARAGSIHFGLAQAYIGLGDSEHGRAHAEQALTLSEATGRAGEIAEAALLLGRILGSRRDYVGARVHFQRALELRQKLANRTNIADVEDELAMLDFRDGHAAEALVLLNRVEIQRRTLRGHAKLTAVLLHKAEVLISLGRLDDALRSVEEARGYADEINDAATIAGVYKRLTLVREARGEYKEALAATRRVFAAEQEKSGEAARRRAAELQTRYDVAKKDEELARLARDRDVQAAEAKASEAQLARSKAELEVAGAELSRSRLQRVALAAGIGAAVVVLGAIAMTLRLRLRAERRVLEETRAARDAAEEADALKSRLLGFASHDLKSPLASLNVTAQLLHESADQPASVRSLAGAMRAETVRMTHLVHDFLDRAALDAGRLQLRLQPTDLAEVVRSVVDDLQLDARRKNQSLTLTVPEEALPRVAGESSRLGQVFANLVGNAIKYSPHGGSIRVTLGAESDTVWCEVRDSGPGIKPEELAKLFQPFSRLSATPTGGEKASGLGLHLARELVALHQGTLSVDSMPGEGAAFRVTLARLEPADA